MVKGDEEIHKVTKLFGVRVTVVENCRSCQLHLVFKYHNIFFTIQDPGRTFLLQYGILAYCFKK